MAKKGLVGKTGRGDMPQDDIVEALYANLYEPQGRLDSLYRQPYTPQLDISIGDTQREIDAIYRTVGGALDEWSALESGGYSEIGESLAQARQRVARLDPTGGNVQKLVHRGNIKEVDFNDFKDEVESLRHSNSAFSPFGDQARLAKSEGYDGVKYLNVPDSMPDDIDEVVIFDPSNIRSVNADFDPKKRNSSNLLASAAPVVGTGALAAGLMMSPQDAMASMQGEGLKGGLDLAMGALADTGQFAYAGGNAIGDALMGRSAREGFLRATEEPWWDMTTDTAGAVGKLADTAIGALMDYEPPLRGGESIGDDLKTGFGWYTDTAHPWLEENIGEYGTNLAEGAGMLGAAVMGGKNRRARYR